MCIDPSSNQHAAVQDYTCSRFGPAQVRPSCRLVGLLVCWLVAFLPSWPAGLLFFGSLPSCLVASLPSWPGAVLACCPVGWVAGCPVGLLACCLLAFLACWFVAKATEGRNRSSVGLRRCLKTYVGVSRLGSHVGVHRFTYGSAGLCRALQRHELFFIQQGA